MSSNETTASVHRKKIVSRLTQLGATQRELAEHLDIHASGLSELLKGNRKLSAIEAELAAEFLRWSIKDVHIAFGIASPQKGYGKLYIQGYIDADSGSLTIRSDVDASTLEEIDAPFPGYSGICVKIKGNSMAPRYRDGEAIGYTPSERDFSSLINHEVVTGTADGRILLKVLHKGNGDGRYTLSSLNPENEPIINIELSWAAPIDWHVPRRT